MKIVRTGKYETVRVSPKSNPEAYVEAVLKRPAGLPLTLYDTSMLTGLTVDQVKKAQESAMAKIREVAIARGVFDRRTV